jgi:hypothetical protein
MLGSFFKTADVDQFADGIIAEVKRYLPVSYAPGTKGIADRAERLNQSLSKRCGEFVRTTKLNIYKKARLAARVREGMSAHGYPDAFVRKFSFDLLARLQNASKSPEKVKH